MPCMPGMLVRRGKAGMAREKLHLLHTTVASHVQDRGAFRDGKPKIFILETFEEHL
jgi:hypothetical protein